MGRLESQGGGSWVLRWQRASGVVAAGVWAQWALQSWTLQRSVQAESPHPTLVVALPPPPVFSTFFKSPLDEKYVTRSCLLFTEQVGTFFSTNLLFYVYHAVL